MQFLLTGFSGTYSFVLFLPCMMHLPLTRSRTFKYPVRIVPFLTNNHPRLTDNRSQEFMASHLSNGIVAGRRRLMDGRDTVPIM